MKLQTSRLATALAGVAALCAAGQARAQAGLRIEPSIGVIATVTDNVNPGSYSGERDKALVLELRPQISVSGQSSRIRANGTFGLQMLTFAKSDEPSRTYPEGRLEANVTLLERWIFVDTEVSARHAGSELFSLQSGSQSTPTADDRITYSYRLSPYVQRELSPGLALNARSDKYWTRLKEDDSLGLAASNSDSRRNSASLEKRPEPFGGALEAFDERSTTDSLTDSLLASRGGRVVASYAVNGELQFGLSAGRERSTIDEDVQTDSTYGFRLRWTPSERARFEAQAERRYFGWGGSGLATLRSPFFAFTLEALRAPVMQSSPLFQPGIGQNLGAALDAVLTTRYPDVTQRETLVRNLLTQRGLDPNAVGPVDVFPDYAQLLNRVTASIVFLGRLTTVELRAFGERSTVLLREDQAIISPIASLQDNRQRGLSLTTTRRLTPQLAATLDLSAREIRGLGDATGQLSREGTATLGARMLVNPRSEVSAGLRYRLFRSNVLVDSEATSVFVGALHRF